MHTYTYIYTLVYTRTRKKMTSCSLRKKKKTKVHSGFFAKACHTLIFTHENATHIFLSPAWMWCRGCGHNLIRAPFNFSLTSDVCVDGLPRERSQQLMTNTYARMKSPTQHNCHTADHHHNLRHPLFWHRTPMLNDNSSRVSGYITQSCWPLQRVDAQRVWLVALLTVSSGCQLTAAGSNCPTQTLSALPPVSDAVSITNFWVPQTVLSPSGKACSNALKLTLFEAMFLGRQSQYANIVWMFALPLVKICSLK